MKNRSKRYKTLLKNKTINKKLSLKEILDLNSIQVIDGAEFVEKDLPKGKTIVILTSQSGETRDLYKNISIFVLYPQGYSIYVISTYYILLLIYPI